MDTRLADHAHAHGFGCVAGVDEVGRGPLAGPVVAAACIVPTSPAVHAELLPLVRDSKVLKASVRQALNARIMALCTVAIGQASVAEINTLNIRQATHVAMRRALAGLPQTPDFALIDGHEIPAGLPCPAQCVVNGDAQELAIACASIVAKVFRDALMAELAVAHPYYGWARNAGYGTAAHVAALQTYGATPHHRTSFAPVAAVLGQVFGQVRHAA
jgi:ribonuclease HII